MYNEQIHVLRQSLANSREAVQYVTQGINAYHSGAYRAAVDAYSRALQLDPQNTYVLDLKGYSLFKLRPTRCPKAHRHSNLEHLSSNDVPAQ